MPIGKRRRGSDDALDDKWRGYEGVIHNLYEKERKSLKQVKHILETEYDFPQTPLKTYEEVLRDKFGLRKKLKKADWPIVHQHWQKRNGKETGVYLNGTRIPGKRAWKEIRRSGAHLRDENNEKPLPPGIVVRTPSPGNSPTSFRSTKLQHFTSPLSPKLRLGPAISVIVPKGIEIGVNQISRLSSLDPNKDGILLAESFDDHTCNRLQLCLNDLPWNVWRRKIHSVIDDRATLQQGHIESILIPSGRSFGLFYGPKPFSGEIAPHFDTCHFLARAVYLLSNNLVYDDLADEECEELFEILLSRIPRGILLVLLLEDLHSTRATWEALVILSKKSKRKHVFSLLIDIALTKKDWIMPNGHLYLAFAASFDCIDIVQKLLATGARPDQELLRGQGGYSPAHPTSAILEALKAQNIHCIKLLLQNCNVNEAIFIGIDLELSATNFSMFLLQMDDTDELHHQVLEMFLEAGADVDSSYMAEPYSSISTLHKRNHIPSERRLSVLDRSLYKGVNLYTKLLPYSRHAATTITRAGICHAAWQGKTELYMYLKSRASPFLLNSQKFLELILAEQFLFRSWEIETRVAQVLINLGVSPQLYSLKEGISFLICRVLVTARLYGYNNEIAKFLQLLLRKGGAVLNAMAVEAAVAEKGLGMLPQLALLKANIGRDGGLALVSAARLGNRRAVSWLLRQRVDINAGIEEEKNQTVIYLATTWPRPSSLNTYLSEQRPERSASPKMLRYLITCGAIMRKSPDDEDPFAFMSWMQYTCGEDIHLFDKVRLFLDSGMDPGDPLGSQACLLEACFQSMPQENYEIQTFELLLRWGAPVRPGGALSRLIIHGGSDELIEQVLQAGADINSYSCYNPNTSASAGQWTPLQAAAERGDQNLVSKLLDGGADINKPAAGLFGKTALQAACAWEPKSINEETVRMSLIRLLIDRGADVNAPGSDCRGAFLDERATNGDGCTALQIAAIRCDIELTLLLLDQGADCNAPGPLCAGNAAAIDLAAANGRLDMVQLLLNAGAVSHIQGWSGYKGAIEAAEKEGYWTVADLLRRHAGSTTGISGTGRGFSCQDDGAEDSVSDEDDFGYKP